MYCGPEDESNRGSEETAAGAEPPVRGGPESAGRQPEPLPRRILHLDMDAFFAAVEVLDDPSLRGKPVIVGGTPEGHGVVSTASYEARRFGVHSALPAAHAVRLCPHGVFIRPRPGRYAAVSRQVFAILSEYTPLVEPLSIDEAFLDVTGCRPLRPAEGVEPAEAIARELRARVCAETGGLACSVGVAPNKYLAKLSSDLAKPDGLLVVPPEGVEEFLAPLAVSRIWGVGPRTAERLERLGLRTMGDLQRVGQASLEAMLGREAGRHIARLARGIDDRAVTPGREARSISHEITYAEFIPPGETGRIERELFSLSDRVARRLRRAGLRGWTVTLKYRDARFRTLTRSRRLEAATSLTEEIHRAAAGLWRERIDPRGEPVRLLGVGVSGLTRDTARQLDLFEDGKRKLAARLASATDRIAEKLGEGVVRRARLLEGEPAGDSSPPRQADERPSHPSDRRRGNRGAAPRDRGTL